MEVESEKEEEIPLTPAQEGDKNDAKTVSLIENLNDKNKTMLNMLV
jgi:hypothetical protein